MNKLKNIRKEKGYSYALMARLLKISKPYYWQIENNKRNLSYSMAFNISKIFKVKPDDLFYDEFKNIN